MWDLVVSKKTKSSPSIAPDAGGRSPPPPCSLRRLLPVAQRRPWRCLSPASARARLHLNRGAENAARAPTDPQSRPDPRLPPGPGAARARPSTCLSAPACCRPACYPDAPPSPCLSAPACCRPARCRAVAPLFLSPSACRRPSVGAHRPAVDLPSTCSSIGARSPGASIGARPASLLRPSPSTHLNKLQLSDVVNVWK